MVGGLYGGGVTAFTDDSADPAPRPGAGRPAEPGARGAAGEPGTADFPGRSGPHATAEAAPSTVGRVRTSYAPAHDGDPDPGEIVWTWVPYEEADGRGKDRPVLVVARESAGSVLAVQLSSKRHDRDREWVPLGSGPWDRSGRDSWVDLDRVLRVHEDGMRREACALDRMRFNLVVGRLRERYGWE